MIKKKKGYETFSSFWNLKLAKKITKRRKADLIYSANTLSHIKNFNEIFRAIKNSLSLKGVLVLEDPSLLECLKKVAYDQFYCEHLYVFSTISLQKILEKFNLEIFDIENISTHGGSNRYFIKKKELIVLNKTDLISEDEIKNKVKDFSKNIKSEIIVLSTLEKKSISKIKSKLISYVS